MRSYRKASLHRLLRLPLRQLVIHTHIHSAIPYLSTQTIFIGTGSTAVGYANPTTIGSFTPKDILQLRSDIEKLRTHQSFLDHIYTELKDYVSIREKKAEEAYRRSVGGEIKNTHTE